MKNSRARVGHLLLFVLSACVASFGVDHASAAPASSRHEPAGTLAFDEATSTREAILRLIVERPGVHFREICRLLDKQTGVVQYHLKVLEREGAIESRLDGRYKRFYVKSTPGPVMDALAVLRRATAGRIVGVLLQEGGPVNHGDLASRVGVTSQAVTWNCQRLVKLGLLEEFKLSRRKFYQLSPVALAALDALDPLDAE
ncbi:MAG: hypothetical protein Kow0069_26680 [Promethearchaeota archaeon]